MCSCACWPSVCLLRKNAFSDLLPSFHPGYLGFLLLIFVSCLYVLDINLLLIVLFANIFPHSVGCLFVLFMVSFAIQKLLTLIKSHLFIFAFIFFALRGRSKEILLQFVKECSAYVFFWKCYVHI